MSRHGEDRAPATGEGRPRDAARRSRARLGALAAGLLLAGGACLPGSSPAGPLLGVAMSLRAVMPELLEEYGRLPDVSVPEAAYDASGNLRRQVEAGAPFDAVVLADAETVDALVASGRADPATRRVLATNRLVLVGPAGSPPLTFGTIETLPPGERIAIGAPVAVPAGRYAEAALRRLGKWAALEGRLVFGGHVAAVLQYTRRGEVAAAIVYATEARGVDDVVVLDEARGPWAPRAEVVAVATRGGRAPGDGRDFVAWLATSRAREILLAHGFGPPDA